MLPLGSTPSECQSDAGALSCAGLLRQINSVALNDNKAVCVAQW